MKVKKKLSILIVLIVGSVFLSTDFLPTSAQAQKPIEWKLIASWGLESPTIRSFLPPFIEKVHQRSAGRLKISWFGPEAVPPFGVLKPTREGLFDACYTHAGYHPSDMPVGQALDFTEATPKERRDAGLYKILDEAYREKCNVTYLGGMADGVGFHLILRKKIDKVDDLIGLKIRATPSYYLMIKALGGSSVMVAGSEVYVALERGVVDGAMWTAIGILDLKWYEVAKYMVRPLFGDPVKALLVNLDSWNRLPKDLKDILTQAAMEIGEEGRARQMRQFEHEQQELKKLGAELVILPPKEAEKYLNAYYDSMEDIAIKPDPKFGPRMKAAIDRMRKK